MDKLMSEKRAKGSGETATPQPTCDGECTYDDPRYLCSRHGCVINTEYGDNCEECKAKRIALGGTRGTVTVPICKENHYHCDKLRKNISELHESLEAALARAEQAEQREKIESASWKEGYDRDQAEIERLKARAEQLQKAANLLLDYIDAHGWGSIPEPYDSINPLLKLLGREAK